MRFLKGLECEERQKKVSDIMEVEVSEQEVEMEEVYH